MKAPSRFFILDNLALKVIVEPRHKPKLFVSCNMYVTGNA